MSRQIATLTPLALHVLVALADEPRHGYAVIKDIEERTGGALSLRSGTLYVTLQRLVDEGLITPARAPRAGDARRKYYRLTPAGRRAAASEVSQLGRLVEAARARLRTAPGGS